MPSTYGTTPYPSKISRLLDLSKALYTLVRSRKITYSTPSLMAAIKFQDALHRFWEGRDTGTATLEAKLLQQLAAMREEFLYVIFLDLTKSYDALDRSRILEILEGYGVGERV